MADLSLTQQFYIAASDKNGVIRDLKSSNPKACLLAAVLMEGIDRGVIARDGDVFSAVGSVDDAPAQIRPVVAMLAEKPRTARKISDALFLGASNRAYLDFVEAVGKSLESTGAVQSKGEYGIFNKHEAFGPTEAARQEVSDLLAAAAHDPSRFVGRAAELAVLVQRGDLMLRFVSAEDGKALKKLTKDALADKTSPANQIVTYMDDMTGGIIAVAMIAAAIN